MNLLITAPIRIKFSLNASQTAFKTDAFYKLWKDVKKLKNDDFDKVVFYQNKKTNFIYDDKSYDNLEKIEKRILGICLNTQANKIFLEEFSKNNFLNQYILSIEKFEIQIYDNTIAIVDLRIKLKSFDKEHMSSFTQDIEKEIKEFIKYCLKAQSENINQLLSFIEECDLTNNSNIIQRSNKYNDYIDLNKEDVNLKLMWSSCALQLEEEDKNKEYIIEKWLANAVDKKEIQNIKNDSEAYSLHWLKYLFREDSDEVESLWQIMFLSQYYYSVIEVIIYNLKIIINESHNIENRNSNKIKEVFAKNEIINIINKIEAITTVANLHIIDYEDTKKYLNRNHLKVFNNILDAWTFDNILENTNNLLSTVKDRVNSIYNKITSKNNFYTDILLTAIGFFAIIDLVLSLSQYSREYTADAMMSSRFDEENSLLKTLSEVPTDIFIGSGFVISFTLLIVYFIYRKKILP